MASENSEYLTKLLTRVRAALETDAMLREKYLVGQKFRFVPDRLQELLERLEKKAAVVEKAEAAAQEVQEKELVVYVYLYNAQGIVLRNWQNMLTPKVFYEYSVNRPIYSEKEFIEKLLRSKANKMQHAYLSISIKPEEVIPLREGEEPRKDVLGNPLLRVKEGSLRFHKLICFTHNEQDFVINVEGELVKKK